MLQKQQIYGGLSKKGKQFNYLYECDGYSSSYPQQLGGRTVIFVFISNFFFIWFQIQHRRFNFVLKISSFKIMDKIDKNNGQNWQK